jgi:hypothetical protein
MPAHKPMGSLSEGPGRKGWCTSCGAWWKYVFIYPEVPESGNPAYRFYVNPTDPLCEDCIRRWYESGTLVQRFTEPLPGLPAETFRGLFKAARVLLLEKITDENRIIPTLMAAYEMDCGTANPWVIPEHHHWLDARERVILTGLERPPRTKNLRVVNVVDNIIILEWEPVFAELVWDLIFSGMVWDGTTSRLVSRSWKEDGSEPLASRWKSRPPGWRSMTDQARSHRPGVLIRLYPDKEGERDAKPQKVASRYQEVLAAERLRIGRPHNTLMECELTSTCLCWLVAPGNRRGGSKLCFPSPKFVEAVSEGVLREYEDHLVMRRAGQETDPENLIPACVGFLLRASCRIKGRKEVEQLLDEHVYPEKSWKAFNKGNYNQKRKKSTAFWNTTIKKTVHPKIERLLNSRTF